MVSYNEALSCAKLHKGNIDNCTEYENAYVFGCTDDDNYIGGAGHTPVVVWKKSGRVTDLPELLINGGGKLLREFEVDYGGQKS